MVGVMFFCWRVEDVGVEIKGDSNGVFFVGVGLGECSLVLIFVFFLGIVFGIFKGLFVGRGFVVKEKKFIIRYIIVIEIYRV